MPSTNRATHHVYLILWFLAAAKAFPGVFVVEIRHCTDEMNKQCRKGGKEGMQRNRERTRARVGGWERRGGCDPPMLCLRRNLSSTQRHSTNEMEERERYRNTREIENGGKGRDAAKQTKSSRAERERQTRLTDTQGEASQIGEYRKSPKD
eukprot:377154-Rhodomonas_salina.1